MVDTGFENDILNCIRILDQGGVILYPNDTIWGLGCNALNGQAVDKIFRIKNRPANKSVIVLLADPRDILQYVAAPPPDIIDIVQNFDRPTTVIYENGLGFPDNVVNEDGSIAIRIASDEFCRALIKRYRKPIVSTSANLSGAPSPGIFIEIAPEIYNGVDYVVKYRQEDETRNAPSRLVKINDEGSIVVLRG